MAVTFDKVTTEVVDRLGSRTDISMRVRDWVDDAQQWLARACVEVPELETTTTKNLVASQAEYSLKTDFEITDLIGIRLVRNETQDWLMQRFAFPEYRMLSQQSTSSPIRWTRWGDKFVVDPIPSTAESIKIDYRRMPVSGVIEIDASWREFLVRLAVHIGWNALMEAGQAGAAWNSLPPWLQTRLMVVMENAEWEALWDHEAGFYPCHR